MGRAFIVKFIAGALAAAILLFLIYQIPPIHNRLSWRMELLQAYTYGILYPADRQPTPAAALYTQVADTPSAQPPTSTPAPTLAGPTTTPTATVPPTPTPTAIPGKVVLQSPAYERQGINNCGPASLSTYLRYYGWEGDQYTITDVIKPISEDRNVNVEELAYYARTHAGWLNVEYRVGGNIDWIRRLLAAGIPVMVEESFLMDKPFYNRDDLWAGHYLVITGYDDARKLFITQDTYYGADLPVTYEKLDENWRSFNRVLIVAYPPELQGVVKEILGADWDPDVNRQNALDAAQAETETHPEDAFAWFNLGTNLVYFERYSEAVRAYDQARTLGLPQRMLRYQFGPFMAYFHTNRIEDLMAISEYALQRTPNSEEAHLWNGWGLFRQGKNDEAASHWLEALEAHPGYTDAQYALEYIGWIK